VVNVVHDLTIKPREARYGTKKVIIRKNKRLEVTVPPGVKNGTLVKLRGALQITDGYYGDIYVQIHIDNKARNIIAISVFAVFAIVITLVVVLSNLPNSPPENNASLTETPAATALNNPTIPIPDTPTPSIPDPYFTDNATMYLGYLTVFHNKQPDDFPNRGKPVQLTENASATDVTWKELKAFLFLEKTDEIPYTDYVFECASFAEELHNNAEARGIRSAFVSIFFSDEITGHALNAFFTTDKGLVYIDCSVNTDAVAYIEEDKEYGLVPLQMASSFDYDFYKLYQIKSPLNPKLILKPQIVDLVFMYW
jgi:hypothetical protein